MDVCKGLQRVVALLGAAALAACGSPGGGPPAETPRGAPGTVLVLLLSGASAGDDVALAVEEDLTREPETVVFERHYAASPDTVRSVEALFSGFPVPQQAAPAAGGGDAARAEPPVMAELFTRMGYSTFAAVTDERLAPANGLARGFARYEFHPGMPQGEQRELVRGALSEADGALLAFVQVSGLDRAAVAEWLGMLRAEERFARALVVVTSDRGPEAAAPDAVVAGFRDAVVRIPCIVKFPRGAQPETLPPRTTSLTSAVDLLPSLLALAGRDISNVLPGANIFDGYTTGHVLIDSGAAWAFVQDANKLVIEGERRLLFDLAVDPTEQQDVAGEKPELAEALAASAVDARSALSASAQDGPGQEEELDEETLEHLRSLGYIQ